MPHNLFRVRHVHWSIMNLPTSGVRASSPFRISDMLTDMPTHPISEQIHVVVQAIARWTSIAQRATIGKIAYHWQSNPGDDLKDWLDPGNTGQLTLTGNYAPCTPTNTYDAGISLITQPSGSICANAVSPVVTLTNYGSTTLTSVTVNYNVDGNAEPPYNWTGSLGPNQSVSFTLPSVTVSSGTHTFNAYTSNPNNQRDQDNGNNASASSFTVTIADTYVTMVLNLDDYGSETTWQLTLNGGGTVASGGPYNDFENIQLVEEFCVESGECYTFTISDSYGDGICCYTGTQNPGYQDGNYSLGDANGISIWTGSEFSTSETVSFCIPSSAGDCDTLYDPFGANASGFFLYSNSGGGYIAGTNSFGDLAKVQEFAQPQQAVEITGIICWIAAKTDDGASVTANLYALDGPGTDLSGAINNAPGTVLANGSLSLQRVDTSGFFNRIEFNNSATVSSAYAVGLDLSSFGNSDELGLVTNADGDASGNEFAWEQWSDGDWYTKNQAWNTQSDGDFDLGIFPVLCPPTVTGVTDLSEFFHLFPNPNAGRFSLVNSAALHGNLAIHDALGQLTLTRHLQGDVAEHFDLHNETPGIYLISISTDKGTWNTRFILSE